MRELKQIAPTSVFVELYRYGVVVLVVLVILFAHPFVIGLPGRVGEARFERSLRPGMSRDQVVRLWNETGDRSEVTNDGPNTLGFSFVDFGTICVLGGSHVSVRFDKAMLLQSWRETPWSKHC